MTVRAARRWVLIAIASALICASCSSSRASSSPSSTSTSTSRESTSSPPLGANASPLEVAASRQPLTNDPTSPVVHDNEVMALAPHDGRLFAATDQWMYAGPNASGQVLVKNSADGPWQLFEQTQSLRVQALDSFPIPVDQGLGAGHALLITQAIIAGHSELQWLLDGASSFAPANAFRLSSNGVDVRSFGTHVDGGTWAVYAGANPTGILRGTWSPTMHALVFDPIPELRTAPPGSPGVQTEKVTGFADCGGALYTSITTKLYRRNDGTLLPGVPRWVLVYEAPPVGAHNSGLRGLSCATHDGESSLLVSTEGNGKVFRFDSLPHGQLDERARLSPTLELSPIPAIRQMLAAQGTTVPVAGKGAIGYVIAAYNNFETVRLDGLDRQVFGFEWSYKGAGCPATRACGPTALGGASFDAAACFSIRTDAGVPSYVLRCLDGPDLRPPGRTAPPIRAGQAFVSIRTIKSSPFADAQLYFGGYDCNFYPADGTAWIANSPLSAIRP